MLAADERRPVLDEHRARATARLLDGNQKTTIVRADVVLRDVEPIGRTGVTKYDFDLSDLQRHRRGQGHSRQPTGKPSVRGRTFHVIEPSSVG
jgi:hypothetical protein